MTYAPDPPTAPLRIPRAMGAPLAQHSQLSPPRSQRRLPLLIAAGVAALLVGGGAAYGLLGSSSGGAALAPFSAYHPCDTGETSLSGFSTRMIRTPDGVPKPGVRVCWYADDLDRFRARHLLTVIDVGPEALADPSSPEARLVNRLRAEPAPPVSSSATLTTRSGPNGVPIHVGSEGRAGGATAACESGGHVWMFKTLGFAGIDDGDGVADLVGRVGCDPLTPGQ